MTEERKTEKILANWRNIKNLIKTTEGLKSKFRRLTEELRSIRDENSKLKKELRNVKKLMIGSSEL